jgi:hypothetical protein
MGCLVLVAYIHLGGGVLADQNHRESRGHVVLPLELLDLLLKFLADLSRYLFSVNDLCCHALPLCLNCLINAIISQSSIATEKEDCDVFFQPKILSKNQIFGCHHNIAP